MYIDPYLHLQEHQRRTAQVAADGRRRLEAVRAPRPRAVRARLVHRVAQRVWRLDARPVG